MKEAINKTVEGLRQQNILLAQQQSICVALLAYWEKVQEEMEAGNIVINNADNVPPNAPVQAEMPREAIVASTEPTPTRHNPQTDKWVRDTFAKAEAASGTDQVAKILQEARESQEDPDRNRLLKAADELKKATQVFGTAFKQQHGRPAEVEAPDPMPTVEEAPEPASNVQADLSAMINQFLSPTISFGGRGFIAPVHGGAAKQMQEDIQQTTLSRLIAWPTAFYRNRSTGAQQLLINSNGMLVIVTGLNAAGEMGEVQVYDIKGQSFLSNEFLNDTENLKKIVLDTIKWELNKLVDKT